MADERCVCGAYAWRDGWCSICDLPAGASEQHYANLAASILPPVGRCPIPALPTLAGIGTSIGRLKAALRSVDSPTAAQVMSVTGDGWEETHRLLVAGMAQGRIVARELARRRHQGELVGGVMAYSLVEKRT